jgi:hypothetical protein
MGDVRAWRVLKLPARAHIFNVSHLVVPAGDAGMTEPHEVQASFLAELLKLEDKRVEKARLKLRREELKAERKNQRHATPRDTAPRRSNHHLPNNAKFHTWRGFVLEIQRLVGLLEPEQKVSKENLAMLGPDTATTITRVMKGYGLSPLPFDPMSWNPDEARVYTPKSR